MQPLELAWIAFVGFSQEGTPPQIFIYLCNTDDPAYIRHES